MKVAPHYSLILLSFRGYGWWQEIVQKRMKVSCVVLLVFDVGFILLTYF
jgi:hypothetical protein